jgi:azurin
MTFRITLVTAACALALTACGKHEPAEETANPAAPATAAAPAPAATTAMPAAATTAMPSAATTAMPSAATTAAPGAMATEKPAAVVKDCATTIEGTDAMQYNVGSITVPASCSKFTINLKHSGTMAITAMGHNVVIAKASDMAGVAADGMAAGAAADYVKAGDPRVVAHTKLVGGGQSTSVSFDPKKIKDGGPYSFFCTFPGHDAMMKGTISVG